MKGNHKLTAGSNGRKRKEERGDQREELATRQRWWLKHKLRRAFTVQAVSDGNSDLRSQVLTVVGRAASPLLSLLSLSLSVSPPAPSPGFTVTATVFTFLTGWQSFLDAACSLTAQFLRVLRLFGRQLIAPGHIDDANLFEEWHCRYQFFSRFCV